MQIVWVEIMWIKNCFPLLLTGTRRVIQPGKNVKNHCLNNGVPAASGGRAIREHSRCHARLGSAIRLHCSTLFRNGLLNNYNLLIFASRFFRNCIFQFTFFDKRNYVILHKICRMFFVKAKLSSNHFF